MTRQCSAKMGIVEAHSLTLGSRFPQGDMLLFYWKYYEGK